VPGKEIWITEWGANGAGNWSRHGPEPVTPAMFAQAATRMLLAILRQPAVTRELFFTLNFDPPKQSYFVRAADGAWRPEPAAQILGWFNRAANGGVRYQRVVERGAKPVAPGVSDGDSYREVEGAIFTSAKETTLLLQNAGSTARFFDPTVGGRTHGPRSVELIATPDLDDAGRHAVQIVYAPVNQVITVPAFSVIQVVWAGAVAPF